MNIMQEEWKQYRDACYPDGLGGIQNREIHQAFFAGALVALQASEDIANGIKDETTATKALMQLRDEVIEVCLRRVAAAKARD